jgi:pimeloyl-ACP methyl ester carboxylesterase
MIDEQETHRHVVTSYKDVPTRTIAAGGVNFAYRELGPKTGVPVIFLTHLAAVLDNWDPRVVDGIAAEHPVITFDNRASALPPVRRRTPSRRWPRMLSPSSGRWAPARSTSSASPWAA